MTPTIDRSRLESMRDEVEEPLSSGLRYMHRRRVDRSDRNGDPLDGIVNLFDVAIVLAVAFLLAALTSIGLSDLLSDEDVTVVTNPGQPDMSVVFKRGDEIQRLELDPEDEASGVGELIGRFYKLEDGTTVYVPAEETPPEGGTSEEQPPEQPAREPTASP